MKIDGAIVTTTTNNNYGNIAQRWALQKFLERHGLNFISYYFYGFFWRVYFIKQSSLTEWPRRVLAAILGKNPQGKKSGIYNYRNLSKFCNERINQRLFLPFFHQRYSAYIIGSDQNLGTPIKKEFFAPWYDFLLHFVKWDAKRISYASSFGKEYLSEENAFIKSDKARSLIEKFDAIAVREKSGVAIAKEIWGVDVRQVVDPTLLLTAKDYSDLIASPTCDLVETKPLFYYLLRSRASSPEFRLMERIAKELQMDVAGTTTLDDKKLMPFEQWLKGFRDSEFVVTNGFHGTVFAIINHKPFVTLASAKESSSSVRYRDLLKRVGLADRIIFEEQFSEFDVTKLGMIDWGKVDRVVDELREDSARWLINNLKERK